MRKILSAAVAVFCMTNGASAATVVYDAHGRILGATGVEVLDNVYNVDLAERALCSVLFDGCDEVSDFAFQTEEAATAASQALLDQVFLNGRADMLLIFGMSGDAPQVWTPYGLNYQNGHELVLTSVIDATPSPSVFSGLVSRGFGGSDPVGVMTDETWAQWRLLGPITPVPLPATLFLLAGALMGFGVVRSRRPRSV